MKRIGILVSEETKMKWESYVDEIKNTSNITTVSKLIREAVKFYIDSKPKFEYLENFSKLSHDLKEPLTAIKGFSQLILDHFANKLDVEVLLRIKEIHEQSNFLEQKINEFISSIESIEEPYDILIIEDDKSTILVLTDYFDLKGYTCKGVTSAVKGLDELKRSTPKLILLDIILPDIIGYEVCKQIKDSEKLKHIPVYYITAIPESEVKQKMIETKADGFILKPFDFTKVEKVFQLIPKTSN